MRDSWVPRSEEGSGRRVTEHQVRTAETFALEKLRKKGLLFELAPLDLVELTQSVARAHGLELREAPMVRDAPTDVELLHVLAHWITKSDEHTLDWLRTYLELVQRWCDMETESLMRQEFLRQGIRFQRA